MKPKICNERNSKKAFAFDKKLPLGCDNITCSRALHNWSFHVWGQSTNIYDVFDEWYYSILIIYAIFLGFIVHLSYKLNKALAKLNELDSKDANTQDSDE